MASFTRRGLAMDTLLHDIDKIEEEIRLAEHSLRGLISPQQTSTPVTVYKVVDQTGGDQTVPVVPATLTRTPMSTVHSHGAYSNAGRQGSDVTYTTPHAANTYTGYRQGRDTTPGIGQPVWQPRQPEPVPPSTLFWHRPTPGQGNMGGQSALPQMQWSPAEVADGAVGPPPWWGSAYGHTMPSNIDARSMMPPDQTPERSGYCNWNQGVPATQMSARQEEDSMLHRLSNVLQDRLPRMEPEVFSGDIMKFPIWLTSFEALIEQRTYQACERLYFLGKYTSGDAKSCIQMYLTLYTDEAYARAKYILLQRYGDKVKVAQAYRRKLEDWPNIKPHDGEGLRRYSDFLWQCHAAMSTISYLGTLNSAEDNQRMARKLPPYIVDRWRRKVDTSLYGTENPHYPVFEEFCQFLSTEARVACGPCITKVPIEAKSDNKDKTNKKAAAHTFSVQTDDASAEPKEKEKRDQTPGGKKDSKGAQIKCFFCKGSHMISRCEIFLALEAQAKKAFAQGNGLCFGCLRRNHMSKDCRSRNPRLMEDGRRNTDVGEKAQSSGQDRKADDKSTEKKGQETAMSYKTTTGSSEGPSAGRHRGVLHSMIVPVKVSHKTNPDLEVMTYALLDSMSDSCFIKHDLIERLKAESVSTDLEVTTLVTKTVITTEIVKGLTVQGMTESAAIELPKTYGRDDIPIDRSLIPQTETVKSWTHLQHIAEQLYPYRDDVDVGLLIGSNCSAAMIPKEVVAREDDEPYAVKTSLGWSVVGWVQQPDHSEDRDGGHFAYRTSVRELGPREVKQMFEMDFCESVRGDKISVEDREFLQVVNSGIHQRADGHLETPLPLKKNTQLPNNRIAAEQRLKSLKNRMMRDKKYQTDYITSMEDVLQKGYAELVPPDELQAEEGRVWYIPHHGVYHPHKPDKLRVVYDCSATYQGKSLNQSLLQGPDLTNRLVGILCRFRQEPIAVICDVEGMFLQVGVEPRDRDFLRFLWWKNGDFLKMPSEYRMKVHLFGATSSPACANFALKKTADLFEERHGKLAADFVRGDFYVDDGLKSVVTPREAVKLIESTTALCQAGGFRLHKFTSNCKEVIDKIPEESRATGIREIDLRSESLPVERALGTEWCLENDALQFRVTLSEKPTTRRGILSTVSSIYDPLGLIAPVLLPGKKILQELCKDGRGWDDPVGEDLSSRWSSWRLELQNLSQLQIRRCYKPDNFGDVDTIQLHHFSDASSEGYGQCSYIRLVDKDNRVATSLVMAKSRVTPTKTVTIPRLELTAAVTSVKVGELLNGELSYENIENFYWTDSQVVLGYVANDSKRFHVFVANRIQQIHDRSDAKDWHYVPTKLNPADLASRGITAEELNGCQLWWKGPEFLSSGEDLPLKSEIPSLKDNDSEVKRVTVLFTTKSTHYANLQDRLRYFSSWYRAKKAIAICRQYLNRLRGLTKKPIDVDSLCEAERLILCVEQQEQLSACYAVLKKQTYPKHQEDAKRRRQEMKKESNIYRLDPYMDEDGLIRVGGRIRRASVSRDVAHPILVPDGHIARLLIEHYHAKTGHSGRTTTLNEVRAAGYWVLRGRAAVGSVINRCVTCRKLRYPPERQKMADLPSDRMEPAPPFTNTGVDYFGPFYTKEGRSQKKRWGCLFTCLSSRAIHIEVAHSLSTDSFLNAYRRFVGRRGPVRLLRSDRGTNFVGAKAELEAALAEMDQDKVGRELLRDNCDWVEFRMNFPHSSHMGGSWERMIRSCRSVLASLLEQHGSCLDDETLHTFMVEVEAVVNSRPLTAVADGDSDVLPLSPSQLLTMKTKTVMPPPGRFVKEDIYCRKRWRRVQHLADEFWKRWKKEYLQSLQSRRTWVDARPNLEEGDIVIMVDESAHRSQWPKAIIKSVHPSKDGLVRKVTVKTSSGEYDRPVHKVVFLCRPRAYKD